MKTKFNFSNKTRLGFILAALAVSACIMAALVYSGASKIIAMRNEAVLQTTPAEIFTDTENSPDEGTIPSEH